ncbi:MAG TPA: hypothetical protein VNF04_07500, partial [Stellaceae bacterium]|nr:hypothetical protein [Stellaceae bacterium]
SGVTGAPTIAAAPDRPGRMSVTVAIPEDALTGVTWLVPPPPATLGAGPALQMVSLAVGPLDPPAASDDIAALLLTGAGAGRKADSNNATADAGSGFGGLNADNLVSLGGVIRAIRDSEIVVRTTHPDAPPDQNNPIWLYDELAGALVAPEPEPLTILLDGNGPVKAGTPPEQQQAALPDAMVTAELLAPDGSSWLATLRQFGGAAVRAWLDG